MPVWLGPTGSPVAPPARPGDLVVVGVVTPLMSWLAFSTLVGAAFLAVRALLDRHRRALWDREWRHSTPGTATSDRTRRIP